MDDYYLRNEAAEGTYREGIGILVLFAVKTQPDVTFRNQKFRPIQCGIVRNREIDLHRIELFDDATKAHIIRWTKDPRINFQTLTAV